MASLSLAPADLALTCVDGDDLSLTFTITEDGSNYDWTGASVASTIVDIKTGAAAAVSSFTLATPTNGTLTASLTDTQTSTLGPGTYRYAISVTKSSLTRTWLAGQLSVMEPGYAGPTNFTTSLSIDTGAATIAITGMVQSLAANISVSDSGGYYTGPTKNVETVLAEIAPGWAKLDRANAFTAAGALKWGPSPDTGELSVREVGDDGRSVWELKHSGDTAYIIHLTSQITAAGVATGASLIGLGVDVGGTGLFVNNKDKGVGIKVTQNDTISSATAYGLLVNASSTTAPGAWFGQGVASAAPAVIVTANVAPAASQKLMRWQTTVSTASDTEIGHIRADSGLLQWNFAISCSSTITASGAITSSGGDVTGVTLIGTSGVRAQGSAPSLQLYQDSGGTSNQRRFHWSISGANILLTSRNDAGSTTLTPLTIAHTTGNITYADGASFILGTTTGTKIGTATTQKIGFYNATPIVQPSGIGAAATDAATTQTLANNLRTALINLGLVAA